MGTSYKVGDVVYPTPPVDIGDAVYEVRQVNKRRTPWTVTKRVITDIYISALHRADDTFVCALLCRLGNSRDYIYSNAFTRLRIFTTLADAKSEAETLNSEHHRVKVACSAERAAKRKAKGERLVYAVQLTPDEVKAHLHEKYGDFRFFTENVVYPYGCEFGEITSKEASLWKNLDTVYETAHALYKNKGMQHAIDYCRTFGYCRKNADISNLERIIKDKEHYCTAPTGRCLTFFSILTDKIWKAFTIKQGCGKDHTVIYNAYALDECNLATFELAYFNRVTGVRRELVSRQDSTGPKLPSEICGDSYYITKPDISLWDIKSLVAEHADCCRHSIELWVPAGDTYKLAD